MYSFFDYLPQAQDGMQQGYIPRLEDFPDYNSYRAAMDEYTAMNGYDQYPQQYDSTSQQVRWHPEWDDQEITPQQAQMVAQAQNVQAQQPVTPTSAPIPTRASYTGPSIVDYLGMNGKASDFNSRKILAKSLGIDNYKGTASQNTKLLKQLLDNPNAIGGYNFTVNPGNTGGSNIVIGGTSNNSGGGNNGGGIPNPNPIIDSTGNPIPTPSPILFTDSIMSADHKNTGVVTPKTTKSTDTTSGTTKLLALVAATVAAGGITAWEAAKFRNLIKSGAFKNSAQLEEELSAARYGLRDKTMTGVVNSAKEFQKWWKDLPKKQKSILNNLDANEIAGFNSELRAGTGLKDLEAFNAIKEGEAEAQILKDAKLAEGVGKEARTTGQVLKEAYMAAKSTPWLMKTLNVAKKLRFKDGGSTFSGNAWYQDGGDYDTNTMNASSPYGYEMGGYIPDYQMAYGGTNNPGFNALPEYVQAKILSNMAQGGEKMPPEIARARFAAAGNLDQMDNYGYAYGGININPANEGKFTASARRAGMGVQEFASKVLANKEDYSSTQVKRANFARNAAGWNKANGGMVGNEIEVTPQEAEMLRQQGYQFEIL
jgi:hypothetical protein